MAENVLDSYLIALGFKVDEGSTAKAERAIAKFAVEAAGLGAAVAAASLAVVAGVAKISAGLETLFYASARIGDTVENVQALTFAVGQVGGTVAGARNALEGLGSFLRSNPGAEGFLSGLGIRTRDAKGNALAATEVLKGFVERAKSMPFPVAKRIASMIGLDENGLLAMMRGTGQAEAAIHRMYRAAGLDADKAAKGATEFMNRLRLFGTAITVLEQSVAAKMQGGIGKDIDRLRERLVANFGRISDIITWVARGVIHVADAIVTLGLEGAAIAERIYDWWTRLDKGTRKWVEGIGLAELGMRAVTTGILASPLGRVLAIAAAIAALANDYAVWRAGGKSLIDWKQWTGDIDAALVQFKRLEAAWDALWPKLKVAATPFLEWFGHQFASAIKDTMGDLADFATALSAMMSGDMPTARKMMASIANREMTSLQGPEQDAPAAYLRTGGPGLTPAQAAQNEKVAFGFFKNMGLTDAQAAAFVGSGLGESGLNPNAVGDYNKDGVPTAGGIFQWHPDRRDDILKATGIDVWHAPLADQLKGAAWELSHGYQNAFMKVLADPTAAQGVADVTDAYLKPGDRLGAKLKRSALAADVLGRQAVPQMIPGTSGSPFSAGTGGVTIDARTTVTVTEAKDAKATGQAVKNATDFANNRLMRQAAGAQSR